MEEPPSIRKLDEVVINRIAAGEVIQRPANALKEMIENCIDAKSTNIQITVKEGGLKYLQIIDNGTGIRKEDFQIVCERFTTSKLEKFEDLNSISTYGFRGEALASISHVAHLTIQSKTANCDCAYKATYEDGILKGTSKPCAGNQGTIITVEDLFYNMATRRKALKNATEEFHKISDVVGKYAIHNSSIGFGLKKYGENNTIKTPPDSNHIDNIRTIYGIGIARELMEFEHKDESLQFRVHGFITNVNYSSKKGTFLLFINHRLVDSSGLKRSTDQIYGTYLPRNMHPFVYISLEIDPKNVDVNVHPTKQEVHFLHEEQIIEKIAGSLEAKLLGSNNSRVFYTQFKLPGVIEKVVLADEKNKSVQAYDKNMVRTDSTDQKLDKFLCAIQDNTSGNKTILNMSVNQQSTSFLNIKSATNLTSVIELRIALEENCHLTLRELVAEHVFVGCINTKQSLIQHSTKLYLCNTEKIMEEMFYQIVMYNFDGFDAITFSTPLSLFELAKLGISLPETGWTPEEGPISELAERVVEILMEKSAMLNNYFSIKIDSDKNLVAIPVLIGSYIPSVSGLPMYILRLATEVDWNKEKSCFHTLARETAIYYAKLDDSQESNWKWITENLFYPVVKNYFLPPKIFTENASILQIADLPNLYKVFERC